MTKEFDRVRIVEMNGPYYCTRCKQTVRLGRPTSPLCPDGHEPATFDAQAKLALCIGIVSFVAAAVIGCLL